MAILLYTAILDVSSWRDANHVTPLVPRFRPLFPLKGDNLALPMTPLID
jgi:hypothetical protein